MKRILFVDDEPQVLNGLRRSFFSMRSQWDMHFCSSGQDALAELERGRWDVVVSDLRMPAMDGVQLLTRVRTEHPGVVRIILSGHGDRAMILQSTEVAHQFIAKPCDPKELRATVARTCALRDALTDERLMELTANLKTLPSLPTLYQEILREVQSPNGSLDSVGRSIAKDVAMTAKVLQLVNSAFFGLRQRVSTPEEAVRFLGMGTVRSLALTVQVFSQITVKDLGGTTMEQFLEHALAVGDLARRIARLERAGRDVEDQAFLGGMLHDLGELVLAANLGPALREAREAGAGEGEPVAEAETRRLGASHAAVGAYLLGIWGLPHDVVEAVAGHHAPPLEHADGFAPATAVHVADVLDRERRGQAGEGGLCEAHLEAVGLLERVDAWREEHEAAERGRAA